MSNIDDRSWDVSEGDDGCLPPDMAKMPMPRPTPANRRMRPVVIRPLLPR